MAYPKNRFIAIELEPASFWGKWHRTAHRATLPSLLKMLKDTGRWEMWDLKKRGGVYDAAGEQGKCERGSKMTTHRPEQ